MGIISAVAIYFIIWWLVLFTVLPWGVRSQADSGEIIEGSEPGAPIKPYIARKLMVTTLIAALIFAGFYAIYAYELITLNDLPL